MKIIVIVYQFVSNNTVIRWEILKLYIDKVRNINELYMVSVARRCRQVYKE